MNKKASDFYEKNGYSLKDQGINEFLIPLCLAKDFFVLCREEKYLILGGDIYKKFRIVDLLLPMIVGTMKNLIIWKV